MSKLIRDLQNPNFIVNIRRRTKMLELMKIEDLYEYFKIADGNDGMVDTFWNIVSHTAI